MSATQNDNNLHDDFYPIPMAFSVLAKAARTANPEAFQQSAHVLDTAPSYILRGLSYASYLLSNVPEGEAAPQQHSHATRAIAEVTELMACLIEHQQDAEIDKMLAEIKATSGQASTQ